MAIHYISDIIHVTCASKSGRRRSPMTEASYISDLPLLDETTGRTIYRPHRDGTVMWGTEIVSRETACPYSDTSVPVQERWQRLNNDTYKLMKKDSEQHHFSFYVALPNSFSQKQAQKCAHNLAMSISEKTGCVIGYGIHKKEGNLHVHINGTEWSWENDHWGGKGNSYYKGKDGSKLYGKKDFYDEHGNDRRIPLMETVTMPDGSTVTRQKRGKKGDLQWERVNVKPFYKQATWLHDEVDKQINKVFFLSQSLDRVVRANKKVRQTLDSRGMHPWHIDIQSYRKKDERYHQAVAHNKREKSFRSALTTNLKLQQEADRNIRNIADNVSDIERKIKRKETRLQKRQTEIDNNANIVTYVENELRPEVAFEHEAESRYSKFRSIKKEISQPLVDTLDMGLRSTNNEIAKIKNTASTTKRETAKIRFLSRNAKMMTTLHDELQYITECSFTEHIRENARKKWRGLSGWRKLNYVQKRFGTISATIYQEYLGLSGNCPDSEKFIPIPLAIPDTQKLQNRIQNVADEWKQSMLSDDHMPPTNVSVLSELLSLEGTVTGTSFDTGSVLSADYNPLESKREYEHTIQQIERDEQTEAARKAAEEAARIEQERIARERAEQERIAREQAEAARKAEAERQKRERIERERREVEQRRRQEEERRRQEEQRRKEEAERLAEQKRIEEQRRAEEEKAASVTVATTQGAATSSQTDIEQRPTKRDYYELSDKVMLTKIQIMIDTARATIAAGTAIFRTVSDGIEYYDTHQLVFERDMKSVGLDSATLTQMQSRMKEIWPVVKDEQIERPILVLPQPQPLLSPDQLQIEEDRYQSLIHKAQIQKDAIIENIIPIAIINYMNYENSHRRKYNLSHPEQKRKEYLQYDDAVNELREKLDMHTEVLTEMAKRYGVDISSYTSPIAKAASVKRTLDENYTYNNLENRKSRTKRKPLQKKTPKERTKNKDKDKGKDFQANK